MLNTEKDGWEDNGQLMLSHQCLLSEPWDCSRLRRDWCAGRQESVFRKQMLYFILLLSLGDGIIRRRSGAVIWIWPMKGLPGRAWRRSSGGSWSGIFSYNIRLKNTINNIGKKKSETDFYWPWTSMTLVKAYQREILYWSTVTLSLFHFPWGLFCLFYFFQRSFGPISQYKIFICFSLVIPHWLLYCANAAEGSTH